MELENNSPQLAKYEMQLASDSTLPKHCATSYGNVINSTSFIEESNHYDDVNESNHYDNVNESNIYDIIEENNQYDDVNENNQYDEKVDYSQINDCNIYEDLDCMGLPASESAEYSVSIKDFAGLQ